MDSELSERDLPRVSVIIPAYNARHYIGAAIQSVQAQTFRNFEVIVIDDASTDDTAAIVEGFCSVDPRVRYAQMARNSGPAASRNRGLALARGEWIALLDADDQFAPGRLETLLSLAHDTEAEVVSDNILLRSATSAAERRMLSDDELSAPRLLTFTEFIEGCQHDASKPERVSYVFLHPVFKREFIEANRIKYNEACRNGEDFLFYVDCFMAQARWFMTPEPLYIYLIRGGSLTEIVSRDDRRQMVTRLRAVLRDVDVARNPRLSAAVRKYWRFIASDLYYWSFKDAVRSANHRDALRTLSLDRAAPNLILNEILKRGIKAGWRSARRTLTG